MNRGEIRAVFFDVFGTLILYPQSRCLEVQFAGQAARLGLSISPDRFAAALPVLREHLRFKALWDPSFAKIKKEGRRKFWEYFYVQLLRLVGVKQNIKAYASGMFVEYVFDSGFIFDPGAPILLSALQPHFTLGIISNAPKRLREILDRENLTSFMDVIVISSEVGAEKPDPEIFRIALDKAGLSASEVIYVGDDPAVDVDGVKSVGMIPVLLDKECFYSEISCQRIRSLLELQELLGC